MKRTELQRKTELRADPERTRVFVERSRRSSAKTMVRPRAISPASPEQRAKVAGRVCASCGDPSQKCDPAHLTQRSQGGCDHPDCVVPLCRGCHRLFDEGALDLESVLALPNFAAERSHMAGHASFAVCVRRLRGERSA